MIFWAPLAFLPLLGCMPADAADTTEVRGITISTPTYGPEWGSDAMASTLDVLAADGVNWITYHPYARVKKNGHVGNDVDTANPKDWLVRPIREAHARGLKVMVKPHLAHWGSGFSWRGDIRFDNPEDEARFFTEYRAWIVAMATISKEADAFVVGTELDGTTSNEEAWRGIIREVRAVHPGHLTFASNWDQYATVPFWDALDTIGIQAYFPLTPDVPSGTLPSPAALDAGWDRVLADVKAVSDRTGKPVIFTELGYDTSPNATREPWASGRGGEAIQEAALRHALHRIGADSTVRGAFLWKWFPGEVPRGDFRLTRPPVRAIIREAWVR